MKSVALFRRVGLLLVLSVFLWQAPLSAAVITGSSPWAQDCIAGALSVNLVPEGLHNQYTRAATYADFCSLSSAFAAAVSGKAETLGFGFDGADSIIPPESRLTRELAAALLTRLAEAAGLSLPKQSPVYSDSDRISAWALEGVGQMQAGGVMNGTGEGRFSPADYFSVEQGIATFLKLYDLSMNNRAGLLSNQGEFSVEIADQETPLAGVFAGHENPILQQYTLEVIEYTNQEREKAGLAPLLGVDEIHAAACVRAGEIALQFGHYRPNGSLYATVYTEFEVKSRARAENIAGNFRTPEKVVWAWMNSISHRICILDPRYTRIGVGIHMDEDGNLSWAQLFAD